MRWPKRSVTSDLCVNENFDADYSTYVLQDPTCDAQRGTTDQPGCNQRRCDKSVTTHEKVCVDDTASQQCTKNECELLCADKVFTEVSDEAFCTHWAYDAVDQECYLFYGCIGEQYDDDYELFFQDYGERLALRETDDYLSLRDPRVVETPSTSDARRGFLGDATAAVAVAVAAIAANA